jgi:hypothetical protein
MEMQRTRGVKLREHPLLSHKGLSSWPPLWVCMDDIGSGIVHAEIGNLTRVTMQNLDDSRISLRMNNGRHEYVGHLLFDDQNFCLNIYALLQKNVGKAIEEIGNLRIIASPVHAHGSDIVN